MSQNIREHTVSHALDRVYVRLDLLATLTHKHTHTQHGNSILSLHEAIPINTLKLLLNAINRVDIIFVYSRTHPRNNLRHLHMQWSLCLSMGHRPTARGGLQMTL